MHLRKINDIYLHCVEHGSRDAPVLVLINSLGTDLRLWNDLIPRLAQQFRVVTYDKRGHGLSELGAPPYRLDDHVADLKALLDALDIEAATLCGLSVGGMIALQFAANYPERVEALILSDTAHRIGAAEMWNARIERIEREGLVGLADDILARWVSDAYRNSEPAAFAGWRTLLTRQSAAGYAGTCAAVRDADLTQAAQALGSAVAKIPTLCICGGDDKVTPPALMQELAALLGAAQFAVIDGAGHLPPIEAPAIFGDLLLDFLHGLAPTPSRFESGRATRCAVLGIDHVTNAGLATTAFDADFQRYITESAWGSVWSRNTIPLRERSMLTVALLAALNQHEELALHIRATRNTGASAADVREALLHVAVYAGVPAANHAFKIAREIIRDFDAGRLDT